MDSEPQLSDDDLGFLIEETRRREDVLDQHIETLTRKSYYAFTLATTVFAFYLTSVREELNEVDLASMQVRIGAGGIVFFVTGAVLFWLAHSARSYLRVPDPGKLEDAHVHPRDHLRFVINKQRAAKLVPKLDTANSLGETVNSQHDMLILQVLFQVVSILLFYL